MRNGRVLLDVGGRAPWHPVAREAFLAAVDEGWADPARLHAEGRRARLLLDQARQVLAGALRCRTEEVHLTPGHTASLRTAVDAVVRGRRRVGAGVVLSAVERAALHAAARHAAPAPVASAASAPAPAGPAAESPGTGPTVVPVDAAGRVDLAAWQDAVAAPGVALAALQHANGEVGTLQPVGRAHEAALAAGVPLLVDAGASVGHVDVPPAWDVLAADPGDWGGPSGVGVLAVRRRVRAVPGGPEDADPWSPGLPDVPAAVGAAAALRAVLADRAAADERRRRLVDTVRRRVAAEVPDVEVVGDPLDRLPHVVTFSCLYVDGEALVTELDRLGFAVGSGSACTSLSLEPSHVLAAMGVLTHGNVRLVLGPDVAADDVTRFCDALPGAVARVRAMLGADRL